ncbi:hypothetical protein T07_13228 [Trichinella nelsoni]|uniref:Uncharacterized protein n=1 Tax=Trichinella nelsoni TaxID=6336 RepID=A0A0V0SG41_9BILA|nr:hypothetical protein T07_13228 [Trichinella nelsoni]
MLSIENFENSTQVDMRAILNIARWVVVILMMLSVKVGILAVGLPVCPKGASFTSGRTDKQVVAPVESLTVLSLV